jgi:predicted permease
VRDLRLACRSLLRQRWLTLTVVLTLGVGIGANAAIAILLDKLLFRPPDGVHDPDRLVRVVAAGNYVDYLELRDKVPSLPEAAYVNRPLGMTVGAAVAEVSVECVTGSYFMVVGGPTLLGRTFTPVEETRGGPPLTVISERLWREHFNGSRDVLGQTVRLGAKTFTIVGVAPQGYRGVDLVGVDAWIPLASSAEACSPTGASLLASSRGAWLDVVARLGPHDTTAATEAAIARAFGSAATGQRAVVEPLFQNRRNMADTRVSLWLVGGAAAVLLVACLNAASLLSIRAVGRRSTMAIRQQLGASSPQMLRLVLTEHALLTVFVSVAALCAARATDLLLKHFFPLFDVTIWDSRFLGVLLSLTLLTSAATAIVPMSEGLAAGVATGHDRRLFVAGRSQVRDVFLLAQVAFAAVLVVGAVLFARSLDQAKTHVGYDIDHVTVVTATLNRARDQSRNDNEQLFNALRDRVRSLPDVESVSLSSGSLLGAAGWRVIVGVRASVGAPPGAFEEETAVDPTYFATVGTRVLRGREFTAADNASTSLVAIVSAPLAKALWPAADAVGQCAVIGQVTCLKIVGVTEARRPGTITRVTEELFVPLAQADRAGPGATPQMLLIHSRPPAADTLSKVIHAARGVSDGAVVSVQPLSALADAQTRSWRLGTTFFEWFGAVALLLATIGTYGSAALSVRQRTAEIGLRLAIGARPDQVRRLIVRQGMIFVLAGLLVGLGSAAVTAHFLRSLLFGVAPTDPRAFLLAALSATTAGVVGCALPALRAGRVDPLKSLRHD